MKTLWLFLSISIGSLLFSGLAHAELSGNCAALKTFLQSQSTGADLGSSSLDGDVDVEAMNNMLVQLKSEMGVLRQSNQFAINCLADDEEAISRLTQQRDKIIFAAKQMADKLNAENAEMLSKLQQQNQDLQDVLSKLEHAKARLDTDVKQRLKVWVSDIDSFAKMTTIMLEASRNAPDLIQQCRASQARLNADLLQTGELNNSLKCQEALSTLHFLNSFYLEKVEKIGVIMDSALSDLLADSEMAAKITQTRALINGARGQMVMFDADLEAINTTVARAQVEAAKATIQVSAEVARGGVCKTIAQKSISNFRKYEKLYDALPFYIKNMPLKQGYGKAFNTQKINLMHDIRIANAVMAKYRCKETGDTGIQAAYDAAVSDIARIYDIKSILNRRL